MKYSLHTLDIIYEYVLLFRIWIAPSSSVHLC
jgi:hypothetical protein